MLAEGIMRMPCFVCVPFVRFSDFKSGEYRNQGKRISAKPKNRPTFGQEASRYYDPKYTDAFPPELCSQKVREEYVFEKSELHDSVLPCIPLMKQKK